MVQIYTGYLFCGRIHQELFCTISSFLCFAFSRYTELDTGLVYGVRYRLDTIFPSKLNYPSSPLQKFHFLMIHIYIRYPSCGQIHQESICTISSLSRSAFSRYTETNTSLIQNLQISSFVPHFPHKNPIFWWSKFTLGILPVGKSIKNRFARFHHCHAPLLWGIWSQIQAWYEIFSEESMQNQIHCHAPLFRGTWSQIQAWFEIFR